MLDVLIVLFSFYGFSFMIKEASIFDKPRIWLLSKSVFFYKLLSCWFCVGFHSGWIVYLIHQNHWDIRTMFLWGLAGASVSYLTDLIVNKLLSISDANTTN